MSSSKYQTPTACNCYVNGSVNGNCNEEGKCSCKTGYTGDTCDRCWDRFWNSTGICIGKEGFYWVNHFILPFKLKEKYILRCQSNSYEAFSTKKLFHTKKMSKFCSWQMCKSCDKCEDQIWPCSLWLCDSYHKFCLIYISHKGIDSCQQMYYNTIIKNSLDCKCNEDGATSAKCTAGQCSCRDGFKGLTCGDCKDGYYYKPYSCFGKQGLQDWASSKH